LLATKGLSAAVTALVRRTGASIQVVGLPSQSLPRDVQQAGYAVVAEAVARGATDVRATVFDDVLEITSEGWASGTDGVLPDLVAALGGTFDSVEGRVEAVIPCASSLQKTNS